jgi:hypothetical protein
MFNEKELRILYTHLKDMTYFRGPTREEEDLTKKVKKLLVEKHFGKE